MTAVDAILFDLFGTVVHFSEDVPRVRVGRESRRTTLGWLEETIGRELPGLAFDEFLRAVLDVTREINAARAPEYLEVPSWQRFARALEKLGVPKTGWDRNDLAVQLSEVHMAHLASLTVLPDGHLETLQTLSQRYRLGLVSNFDHERTGLKILADHGVAEFFERMVISDGVGRRKPHAAIFEHCLAGMGVEAGRAAFVGDSYEDDIVGGCGAGMATVWINPKGKAVGQAGIVPDHVIDGLPDLIERFV